MKPFSLKQYWWTPLQLQAVVVFTIAAFLFPFLVHLISPAQGIPLGARLLPMFYAPLVAALLYRYHVAVIAALAGPLLNYWVTGHPLPSMLLTLTLELVLFVSIVFLLRNKRGVMPWILAPLAYILALGFAALIKGLGEAQAWDFFSQAISTGWMGVIILWMINLIIGVLKADN